MGLVKTHSFENVREGLRKYDEEHGKPPLGSSGDATPYVGYETTWGAINVWLRAHPVSKGAADAWRRKNMAGASR